MKSIEIFCISILYSNLVGILYMYGIAICIYYVSKVIYSLDKIFCLPIMPN